jgi:hypothetical protein
MSRHVEQLSVSLSLALCAVGEGMVEGRKLGEGPRPRVCEESEA